MPGTMVTPVLIGREREMEILDRALRAALNGAGGCILLAGEAGIGKSRLASELAGRALSAGFFILKGSCFEQDRSYPYAPWIDALRDFLAQRNPAEVNELIGTFAPELIKILPELSLSMPAVRPSPPLDPSAEKHRLFETLARFTTSLAASQPLLIFIEDLHWSDEQSLELLYFFVRRIATAPILIVGTYRVEDISPHLAGHLAEMDRTRLVEEIQLAPLTRPNVIRMLQAILRTENPTNPEQIDLIMLLSEGIPFFVEELTRSMVETGAPPGQWDLQHIPRGIQHMVQRRVEGLPEETRRVLSLASVAGERFDFGLLKEITGEDEPSLLRRLKDLIAVHLIVEHSADQFAFSHALTRKVVYADLLLRERKAIHRMIGEIMERSGEAQPDMPASTLAYHFYQAEDWQKVMEYSQRAGELAQRLYATREALTHFSHALEAARRLNLPAPRSSLRGHAQASEVLGDFDGALADYEMALEMDSHAGNRAGEWRSQVDLGLLWQSRDLERAGEYYQRALVLARNLEDETILAQTLNRVGNWYFNRGQARMALPYHREALALFRERDDRRGIAHTMDLLGIVSYQLGEVIQGADYLEEVVPILRKLDDRQGLVNTLVNLTMRAITENEVLGEVNYQQLTNLSDEALQIARSFNWYEGEVLALLQGAISLKKAGEYGQALGRLAQARSMIEESQNSELLARLHLILGQIFSGLIALTEARQQFETGLAILQELGSGLLILAARVHLATVAILQSDFTHAHALLDDLVPAEYPEDQAMGPQRNCWKAYAELELAEGHSDRALKIVDQLLASTPNRARYGPYSVPRLSRLRAQALARLGLPEEAKAELRGALPVAQRQGSLLLLWELHADLGRVQRAMGQRDDAEFEFSAARGIIQELADRVPEGSLRDNFVQRAIATMPAAHVQTQRQAAKRESGGLTGREREIAVLIARGKSNREIAGELVISEKTAERHVANILSKLGFNSRTQIAAWTVAKGLVQ